MIENPIRILQINAGDRNFGGVSSFLYNVYTHVDHSKIQFDFLTPNNTTYHEHRDEIEKAGGRVYEFGLSGEGLSHKKKFALLLKKFLIGKNYKIVQINSGTFFFNLIVSIAVKRAKVKNIIVHSHSVASDQASVTKRLLIYLLKPLFLFFATDYFACSKSAGAFMFPRLALRRLRIIYSGLDVEKFKFSSNNREIIRKELNIQNSFVIGHIGRFVRVKNQEYLIGLIKELKSEYNDIKLILVGEGELLDRIKAKVDEFGLNDDVIFTGLRKDVERLYSAFDCYLFPSYYEGLGMSLVEAQISGLNCVASTGVPRDTMISKNVNYIDLRDTNSWIKQIKSIRALNAERISHTEEAKAKGYDILDIARNLQEIYIEKGRM